jgi:hypothetical protein
MTIAALRNTSLSVGACVVIGAALLAPLAALAQADSSTGRSVTSTPVRGATGRQLWRLSDYTTIELVAREPGAPENQHPYAASIVRATSGVRRSVRSGIRWWAWVT